MSVNQLFGSGPQCSWIWGSLFVICFSVLSVHGGKSLVTVGPCQVKVDGRLINLDSLQSTDGTPRFEVEWRGWNYSFNPCTSFNLPANPHTGQGDKCPFVSVCKSKLDKEAVDGRGNGRYFTMGIQSTAKFHTKTKMYQRYRKLITGEQNEGENEESSESEEGEESSESSESEEDEDEVYDYEFLNFLDYKDVKNDKKKSKAQKNDSDSNSGNLTEQDINITQPSSSTNVVNLPDIENETLDIERKEKTVSNDISDMDMSTQDTEQTVTTESVVTKEITVAKGIPVAKEEILDGGSPVSNDSFKSTTLKKEFDPSEEFAEYDYPDVNNVQDKHDNPTYTFKAHERQPEPHLKYKDFLPILQENAVMLTYRGVKTMRKRWTHIVLVCDYRKRGRNDATFTLLAARGLNLYFQLHHRCCCPDACLSPQYNPIIADLLNDNLTDLFSNGSYPADDFSAANGVEDILGTSGPQFLWLVLVVNGSVLACAILIGGMCCRKGGGSDGQYTSMLPVVHHAVEAPVFIYNDGNYALHSSQMTINSHESRYFSTSKMNISPEYLDYSSAITRKQQRPLAEDGIVAAVDLDVGQRLGGGLFGDTYVADLKDRRVAAKRITVGVHQSQLTDADYEWIVREICYLSKQRHKYLVSVLGICTDTRQPYLISEFISGDSLKDLLLREDEYLTWPRKVKMCIQVADALAFLHSAKFPILHRDLRCSNVLVEPSNDRIKVADYGLVKIIQRLRNQCTGRKGCYCQKQLSALPASVRWSAPEVMAKPTTDEYHSDILCPATDMYSFGMMMWEVAAARDPFEEVADEAEVMEIVLSGDRPSLDDLEGVLPHYKEIIKVCWAQDPDERPSFKQVAIHLKNITHILSKMSSNKRVRQRSETTSFLKSALNMAR